MTANKMQQYSLGFIACLFLIMTSQVHGAWAPHNNNNQQGNYLGEDFLDEVYWENVDEYQCNYTSQQGNNLWLFVGNTGAGKSTTINYGLGHDLMEVALKDIATSKVKPVGISAKDAWNADKKVIVVKKPYKGREIAKIGINQVSACTSMPKVYTTAPGSVGLVDCPGFGDTRGAEQRVFNMFAIRSLVEQASNVQAIVYIISYPEVESRKGEVFVEVIKQLDSLLGGAMPYMTSIHFFFTKIRNGIDKQYIINTIKGIKTEKENSYQKICKNTAKDTANKIWGKRKESTILKIVNCLLECNNIHIINPLDGGKSWQEAKVYINENAIQCARIPRKVFTMKIPGIDVQGTLANVYDKKAGSLLRIIRDFLEIPGEIIQKNKQIKLLQVIINKNNENEGKKELEISELDLIKNSITKLKNDKNTLDNQIKKLNSDEIVLYRTDRLYFDNWFFPQEKCIKYHDVPYVKKDIKKKEENCQWEIKIDEPGKGEFEASYCRTYTKKIVKGAFVVATAAVTSSFATTALAATSFTGAIITPVLKPKGILKGAKALMKFTYKKNTTNFCTVKVNFYVKVSEINKSEIIRISKHLERVKKELSSLEQIKFLEEAKTKLKEETTNIKKLERELVVIDIALKKNKNIIDHFYHNKATIKRFFKRGQIDALLEMLDTYYTKDQKEKNNQIQKPTLENDDEKKDELYDYDIDNEKNKKQTSETKTLKTFLIEHGLEKFFDTINETGGFDNSLEDFLEMDSDGVVDLAQEAGVKFAHKKKLVKAHQAAKQE